MGISESADPEPNSCAVRGVRRAHRGRVRAGRLVAGHGAAHQHRAGLAAHGATHGRGFMLAGASLWLACSGATRTSHGRGAALLAILGTVMVLCARLGLGRLPRAVVARPDTAGASTACRRRAWRRPPPSASCCWDCRCCLRGPASQRAAAPDAGRSPACWSAGLGLSRFVFGGEPLFAFADMAIHTALLFLLLRRRADAAHRRRHRRACWPATASAAAWRAACCRRPLSCRSLAGALTVHYERRATFGFEAAVAVFALSSMIVFVAFVWVNAARGERADRLRRRAERALRLSEERNQLNRRDRARRHHHDRPPGA